MSRSAPLTAALGDEPATTSEVYDRVGYRQLARLGLIPYPAFRAELQHLARAGAVELSTAQDGSSLWRAARPAAGRAPAAADPD